MLQPGPVDIVLSIGDETRYCAQCGGKVLGNPLFDGVPLDKMARY